MAISLLSLVMLVAITWARQSVTFDPFMYLSVPIPTRNEKMLRLILLPRIRTKDIIGNASGSDIPVSSSGEQSKMSID